MKHHLRLCVCIFLLYVTIVSARKSTKEWKKFDLDQELNDLEVQWAEEEEVVQDQRDQEYMEKHHPNPVLLFVHVDKGHSVDLGALADRWEAILRTGGATSVVYKLNQEKLIVKLREDYMRDAVRELLLSQPEVMKVTTNNVDYFKNGQVSDHQGSVKAGL